VRLSSPLVHHVLGVVSACAEEEVGRVEAEPNVAGVKDAQIRLKIEPQPEVGRETMHARISALVEGLPIAVGLTGLCPKPTVAVIDDSVGEKASLDRFHSKILSLPVPG
jgi:hypothetical protein